MVGPLRGEQAGPPSSISSDTSVMENLATVADTIARDNNTKNGKDESAFFRKSTKMTRSSVGAIAQPAVSKRPAPMVK